MSLEQSIADLTRQAGQLLDLPQQIAAVAQTQITAVGAEYANRLAGLHREIFLDPVAGSDANTGLSSAAAVKTLATAILKVPVGGRVVISLLNDYELEKDVNVCGRNLLIRSAGTTRRSFTFYRRVIAVNAINTGALCGLQLLDGGSIEFDNVKIAMPPLDGGWASMQIMPWAAIRVAQNGRIGGVTYVGIFNCELSLPLAPFSVLFERLSSPFALCVQSALVSAAPLTGCLFSDYFNLAANYAGVDTASLPWLITNLSKI